MLAKLPNNYLFTNKLLGEGGGGFDFVDGGGGDSGLHPEPTHNNNDPKRKKTLQHVLYCIYIIQVVHVQPSE